MSGSRAYLVAGFAALALQILSYKLISAAGLGDALSIAISLTAFVALSGIGAYVGDRVGRRIARVLEATMGLYALLLFGVIQFVGLTSLSGLWGHDNMFVSMAFLILLMSPMAMIGGLLMPAYETRSVSGMNGNFIQVYSLFHVGGALSLVLIETVGIPTYGWPLLGMILGGVSVLNAMTQGSSSELSKQSFETAFKTSVSRKLKLLFVSIATGVAGVAAYTAFDYVVGPNIRNYGLVTSAIFLGLGLSGFWAQRSFMKFHDMLGWSGVGILWLCTVSIIFPMAMSYGIAFHMDAWWLYAGALVVIMIPTYTLMGLSIPIATKSGFSGGQALLIVSMGNAIGYWTYIGLAPMNISLLLLVGLGFLLIGLGCSNFVRLTLAGLCLLIMAIVQPGSHALHQAIVRMNTISFESWFYQGYYSSNTSFKVSFVNGWNSWGWPVDHIRVTTSNNGEEVSSVDSLVINGFTSLTMSPPENTVISESLSALIPALYVNNREKALVLGAGTGVSASAVSKFFDRVDLVDLNKDTESMLHHFHEMNQIDPADVNLIQSDALSYVRKNSSNDYDYVFSTVTGAGYSFSAFLYTREFFQDVKGILSDDGVFAFWVDYRMGFRGMSEIISALKSEFRYIDAKLVHANFDDVEMYSHDIPYIVISASQSALKSGDPFQDKLSRYINNLDSNYIEENISDYEVGDVLKVREVQLCVDERAQSSSMKTLSFAYDYKTVIDQKIITVYGLQDEKSNHQPCRHKPLTKDKNEKTPNVEVGFQEQPETTSIASEDPEE